MTHPFKFTPTMTPQSGARVKPSTRQVPMARGKAETLNQELPPIRLAPDHEVDPLGDDDDSTPLGEDGMTPQTAAVVSETPLADALVDYAMAQRAVAEAQAQLEAAELAIKKSIMEPGFTYGETLGTGRKTQHVLVTWGVREKRTVSAKKLRAYFAKYPQRGTYEDFLRSTEVEELVVREVTADEYMQEMGE